MTENKNYSYLKIADAINYIQPTEKPRFTLEELAKKLHLSPSQFQQLFEEWAGTNPEKFFQYISISYARKILAESQPTLFVSASEIAMSGASQLNSLFVRIVRMTTDDYPKGSNNISIKYSFLDSLFGNIIVASTTKGICYIAFIEDEIQAFALLQKHFPNASFQQNLDIMHLHAALFFTQASHLDTPISLHLKGTDFQLKVWDALLNIPMGKLTTYGNIAKNIGNPKASRAIGTAIGDNPVAFLIPCHRVIQSTGKLGGYMWGTTRKAAIIAYEGLKCSSGK